MTFLEKKFQLRNEIFSINHNSIDLPCRLPCPVTLSDIIIIFLIKGRPYFIYVALVLLSNIAKGTNMYGHCKKYLSLKLFVQFKTNSDNYLKL